MAHVGVPPEERATPQLLEIDLTLDYDLKQAARTERIGMSIDYAAVHQKIIQIAQLRPRPLIETVAEDVASAMFENFPAEKVTVVVRKFILPNTRSVSVKITRTRAGT